MLKPSSSAPLPKKKRVTKAPDVRREELLQEASALFLEKGVSNTGIGDITDRTGVARGTFYLYFTSKEVLVSELWQRYVAGFMSLTDDLVADDGESGNPDILIEFLTRLAEHALRHAHLHRAIYGSADGNAIALCKRSDEAILARLNEILRMRAHSRADRSESDDLTASLLFHALDGTLHRLIMKEDQIDSEAFLSGVRQFAERVTRAAPAEPHG
jgi:AcrR family transcriptional regulator